MSVANSSLESLPIKGVLNLEAQKTTISFKVDEGVAEEMRSILVHGALQHIMNDAYEALLKFLKESSNPREMSAQLYQRRFTLSFTENSHANPS